MWAAAAMAARLGATGYFPYGLAAIELMTEIGGSSKDLLENRQAAAGSADNQEHHSTQIDRKYRASYEDVLGGVDGLVAARLKSREKVDLASIRREGGMRRLKYTSRRSSRGIRSVGGRSRRCHDTTKKSNRLCRSR